MVPENARDPASGEATKEKLGSWKEIASYLSCGVRTVQRWEQLEELPVHRHEHQKLGSVYAFRSEIDAWHAARRAPTTGQSPSAELAGDSVLNPPKPEAASGPSPPEAHAAHSHAEAPTWPAQIAHAGHDGHGRRIALLAASAALLALTALVVFRRLSTSPKPKAQRAILAVLPFENLSGDPSQDYFSEGLTEEMITDLASVDQARLGVIARTTAMQYLHTRKDIAQIGRELGVNYILEGSVRRSPKEVLISARLIRVSDQTHIWTHSYERPGRDVITIQQIVARSIAARTLANLGLWKPYTAPQLAVDPKAYDDYLRGRYFWNLRSGEGLSQAVHYFSLASQKDPNYAPAYTGLADSYTLQTLYGADPRQIMPKAKEAARMSLALDDSLAEAHTSLAAIDAIYDWNWPDAKREFQRAISLNPSYSSAHHWYANFYLIPQGRYNEAIQEMELAERLDPASLIINSDLGWAYFVARKYDLALNQYKKTVEMSPQFVPVHFRLWQYYAQLHQYDQAVLEYENAVRLDGMSAQAAKIRRIYTARGYPGILMAISSRESLPSHLVAASALSFISQGEKARGLDILQQAWQDHATDLIYIAADPAYDALRGEPRFQELERRIGLTH